MASENRGDDTTGRREFLAQLSTAAAAVSGLALGRTGRSAEPSGAPAATLPTIALGSHRITRLVAGWNPIGGYSYMGPNMNRQMLVPLSPRARLWSN